MDPEPPERRGLSLLGDIEVTDVLLAVLAIISLMLAAYMEHQDVLMGVVTG